MAEGPLLQVSPLQLQLLPLLQRLAVDAALGTASASLNQWRVIVGVELEFYYQRFFMHLFDGHH